MFNVGANVIGTAKKGAGEKTKAAIFETALELFRRRGFEVTTMRDIARSAKVATGAAYYYFPSKEAIVAAYYDQVQVLHAEKVRLELGGKAGLRERLGVAVRLKFGILKRLGEGGVGEEGRARGAPGHLKKKKKKREG